MPCTLKELNNAILHLKFLGINQSHSHCYALLIEMKYLVKIPTEKTVVNPIVINGQSFMLSELGIEYCDCIYKTLTENEKDELHGIKGIIKFPTNLF